MYRLRSSKVGRGAALLALLTTCAPTFAGEPLAPQQIATQWMGRTLIGTTAEGVAVALRLHPDGTAQLEVGDKQDTGRWRLSDTGYCAAWTHIRRGQEACFIVKQDAEAYHIYSLDGQPSAVVRTKAD